VFKIIEVEIFFTKVVYVFFNSSMDFLHHFLSRYWNMIVNDMTIHDKGKTVAFFQKIDQTA